MKFLSSLLSLFHKHKDMLPEDLDSVDEIRGKAKQMIDQHGDKLDQITDKIPGDTDDKLVDKAKDALK